MSTSNPASRHNASDDQVCRIVSAAFKAKSSNAQHRFHNEIDDRGYRTESTNLLQATAGFLKSATTLKEESNWKMFVQLKTTAHQDWYHGNIRSHLHSRRTDHESKRKIDSLLGKTQGKCRRNTMQISVKTSPHLQHQHSACKRKTSIG